MKANSRKRVLISSVAMLLVAMVALGTSTFAWFTNATKANANNINITANAAKGLQISTDSGDSWGTNQSWTEPEGFNSTVSPLSVPYGAKGTDFPTTAYYADKAGVDGAWSEENEEKGIEYTFKSTSISTLGADVVSNPYYLGYKVQARVTGLAEDDDTTYALTATVAYTGDKTADPLASAIRIAIVDSNGDVCGVYGDAPVNAIINTTPETSSTASPVTSEIDCGTVGKDANTYSVYVWIEGQDADCQDTLMNLTGNYKITFSAPGIAA